MAELAIQRLKEEELTCSICLDIYTDPKLLQCFHVYCQQCLVPLGVRDQQGQLGLTCPTCRQVTPIPDRGVSGFQSAFHINHLLEILKENKGISPPVSGGESKKRTGYEASTTTPSEGEEGGDSKGAVGGDITDRSERSGSGTMTRRHSVYLCCLDHLNEELKLYCETCGELVCMQCIMTGGKHHDHEYALLESAFERYKEEITSSLQPMEKQVMVIKKALVQLNAQCGEISNQRAAIEDNIHITFRRLRDALTVRETELIGQLHQVTQDKMKDLAAQTNQMETILAKLDSCLHFMRESLKAGNESDVLTMKMKAVDQVKALTTPFQPDMLKPNTEADMVFTTLAEMTAMCQNYGKISAPGLPDPKHCYITGKGVIPVATTGRKCEVIVQVVTFDGKPYEKPIKLLLCELASEITGTRTSCSIERRGMSQYEISYQPTIKGRHQLHIKVEGQHIGGSPFSIAVKSPVETLGTPILTIAEVESPCGVAINQKGEVVVAEMGGSFISVFSPAGEKLLSFGTQGGGDMDNTCGVAVDGEGNIVVTDCGNHCVQKFTAKGKFVAALHTKGNGNIRIFSPADIAFNAVNNKLYVMDIGNDCVQVLNSDLSLSGAFGKYGSGRGQFSHPCGIACDSTGKVFVADCDNHRIQVFTAKGKWVKVVGGKHRNVIESPVSVAVDTNGHVYVSKSPAACGEQQSSPASSPTNDHVSVFTSDGQAVVSFGRRGEGPGVFQRTRVHGLAVDNTGVVYVCDRDNNHIQIF